MRTDRAAQIDETGDRLGRVASHFVAELFRTLSRRGLSTQELLGDLPITVDDRGELVGPVHLDPFRTLMRRLDRSLGGREGLERCGEWLASGSTTRARQAALAFVASPTSLYRVLLLWAIPRSFPRVAVALSSPAPNRLVLELELPSRTDPCTAILHLTTGILRALPRRIDLPDAVIESRIDGRFGRWEVTLPSSHTGLARLLRSLRARSSPASLLARLESRQLELHANFVALSRAHEEALGRERELCERNRAVVDMICEVDETGRIVFVNEAARDVVGYSPDQMMGSHYRLWVPTGLHALATKQFEAFKAAPIGTTVNRVRTKLHAAHGRKVTTEVSLRSFECGRGAWRAVATLRPIEASERSLDLRSNRVLANSLDRLLGALEGKPRSDGMRSDGANGAEARVADHAPEATRRMTRIVEHVLAGEEREPAEWLEVRKLVGRVRDALAAHGDGSAIELHFDATRAPAELFGVASLVEILIGSLVDWGVESARTDAPDSARCALELELARIPGAEGAAEDVGVALRLVGGSPRGDSDPIDAELAIAIATDAARALGGDVLASSDERGPVRAFRLPQPDRTAQLA